MIDVVWSVAALVILVVFSHALFSALRGKAKPDPSSPSPWWSILVVVLTASLIGSAYRYGGKVAVLGGLGLVLGGLMFFWAKLIGDGAKGIPKPESGDCDVCGVACAKGQVFCNRCHYRRNFLPAQTFAWALHSFIYMILVVLYLLFVHSAERHVSRTAFWWPWFALGPVVVGGMTEHKVLWRFNFYRFREIETGRYFYFLFFFVLTPLLIWGSVGSFFALLRGWPIK